MNLQYRATPDIETRSRARLIFGIAVPFDSPATIHDRGGTYSEVFRRGAFTKTLAQRGTRKVKAMANHDYKRLPIGRAETLREDAAGLYCELKVARTREGDEILELVADGAVDAFSIGFAPVNDRRPSAGVIERIEVMLREISVVAFPAFDGAAIVGVRSDGTLLQPTFDREAARRRLDLIRLRG